jgi:thioredoxin-related protein
MKKRIFIPSLIIMVSLAITAFNLPLKNKPVEGSKVKWLTWTEAVELNKKEKKKILVDVYTDWCGWCKVMDRETFTNDTIVEYLTKNFYCVKLDAEMKEAIEFNGHKFEHVQQGGRGGIHTFAYSLLDGNLGYPSIVYLTENYERVVISPGFKRTQQLLSELKYTAEEIYKTQAWDVYQANNNK